MFPPVFLKRLYFLKKGLTMRKWITRSLFFTLFTVQGLFAEKLPGHKITAKYDMVAIWGKDCFGNATLSFRDSNKVTLKEMTFSKSFENKRSYRKEYLTAVGKVLGKSIFSKNYQTEYEDNLDLGYAKWPSEMRVTVEPFVIESDKDNLDGSEWILNIRAHPKEGTWADVLRVALVPEGTYHCSNQAEEQSAEQIEDNAQEEKE